MAQTPRFGLSRVQSGDSLSQNGYKYSDADRLTIENLIYAALQHHHTGLAIPAPSTGTAPSLDLDSTFGAIPGARRVFYKITWVDVSGNETVATPEAYVDTPSVIAIPGTPVLSTNSTGGTLPPGNYYYVLSAYKTANTFETQATNPAFLTVQLGTSTNKITVGFPTRPTGSNGYNIYRRGPGEVQYSYLTSVAFGATPPTSYIDTGSVVPNAARSVPSGNTTNSSNNITVEVPASTVSGLSYSAGTVPTGYTWKVYRSYVSGEYTNTLLHHVVEESSPGIVYGTYTDTGGGTQQGTPPTTTQFVDQPPQVDLVSEVTNNLPLGRVAFPVVITFSYPGTPVVELGKVRWVSEYPNATIVACRASCGVGEAPSGTDIVVDIVKGTGSNPSPSTIYTTTGNRPKVTVGNQIGTRTTPDITNLGPGDSLSMNIITIDAAATPTGKDVSVNVYMIAWGYPNVGWVPGTTTGLLPNSADTGHGLDHGVKT